MSKEAKFLRKCYQCHEVHTTSEGAVHCCLGLCERPPKRLDVVSMLIDQVLEEGNGAVWEMEHEMSLVPEVQSLSEFLDWLEDYHSITLSEEQQAELSEMISKESHLNSFNQAIIQGKI